LFCTIAIKKKQPLKSWSSIIFVRYILDTKFDSKIYFLFVLKICVQAKVAALEKSVCVTFVLHVVEDNYSLEYLTYY